MNQNPVYEIIERIYQLDVDASAVTKDQRAALKALSELEKKSKISETILTKSRNEMAFNEGEMLRIYKKIDDLDEKKSEKHNRLSNARNDDDHRSLKREIDNIDREVKDLLRRVDEAESSIEQSKKTFREAEKELTNMENASKDERDKAKVESEKWAGRLDEISKVRESYLNQLDDRVAGHYARVARITRNVNGPISRVSHHACGNCHLDLAPQILNHIARGKLVEFCPNCSQVLLPSA